jgi:hypothetical protein
MDTGLQPGGVSWFRNKDHLSHYWLFFAIPALAGLLFGAAALFYAHRAETTNERSAGYLEEIARALTTTEKAGDDAHEPAKDFGGKWF